MHTTLLPSTPEGIRRAAEALRTGAVVAMPTETVYGLAAIATNDLAVAEVFRAKGRPADDPLIVHLTHRLLNDAEVVRGLVRLGLLDPTLGPRLADDVAALATCWPGPLTLVLPRGPAVSDLLTSGLPTVALRIPAHPVATALIEAVGAPLVAPSANRFGRISPTSAEAVLAELSDRIPFVLDGGPCAIGVESTVLQPLGAGRSRLLRPGGISHAQLHALLGAPPEPPEPRTGPAPAPGMSESHYAPRTPAALVPPLNDWTAADWAHLRDRLSSTPRLAWLLFSDPPERAQENTTTQLGAPCAARTLSLSGSLDEAAHHLFRQLRALDEHGAELILIERCPDERGIGAALSDRLRRATHGTPPLFPSEARPLSR